MIYEPETGRPADQDLRPGEKIDDLQRDGLRIIQDPDRFCFGMDAVLLSWYAQARPGSRALDLGTGTGIIPILMSSRTGCASLTGLEIQQESADMAARSVRLNGLEDRILIRQGDIREAADLFPAASFDVITCKDMRSCAPLRMWLRPRPACCGPEAIFIWSTGLSAWRKS